MRRVKKLILGNWMTVPAIAGHLGMTTEAVIDHIDKLDTYQTFRVESRPVPGSRFTREFRVVPRA